jgi:ElaA protein
MLTWQWAPFAALQGADVYAFLAARSEVFVMEQSCAFMDADDFDQQAWHLLGWDDSKARLAAYCRVIAPGIKYAEPSIGRVLTTRNYRSKGLGRMLMAEAIARTGVLHPGHAIRIGAQQRLEKFYREFGFNTVSEVYIEDGIPHLEMLRTAG